MSARECGEFTDEDHKTAWRKRQQKKPKKEDVVKSKKVAGAEHINHVGKIIAARITGPDCKCTRFKCFQNVSEEQRFTILNAFNTFSNKNEQDSYLAGLVSFHAPFRRRSRLNNNEKEEGDEEEDDDGGGNIHPFAHAASYSYKVRVSGQEIEICLKAFLSYHGITRSRIRRIQRHLITKGVPPTDRRGKHTNRSRKTPEPVVNIIMDHIESFKARQSHYSRRKNPNKLYLPETLTVKRMYKMFLEKYRINVSYLVYWSIFKNKFKISFGLPRSDTCCVCDSLQLKINNSAENDTLRKKFETEKTLHQAKAEKFYEIKRLCKQKARAGEISCFSFDFMQNLPLPHIRTSDVFYSSQMWYFVFGIHDLSNSDASMYVYDELTGRKGQNNVTSMLLHFLNSREGFKDNLVLFSDGCSGQNKNFVMVWFLYFVVHGFRIFKKITYYFPIRGHSRLSNDQDFSLIEAKKRKHTAEIQSDWDDLILSAREKPSPFNLVKIEQSDFFNLAEALTPFFRKKCNPIMRLKMVRTLQISQDFDYVKVRYSYSGPWETIYLRSKKVLPSEIHLKDLYSGPIEMKKAKLNSVVKLAEYLQKPENQQYYLSLRTSDTTSSSVKYVDVDDDDNSSGED